MPPDPTSTYRESIEAAHAARVARLRSATGWLSLVGKTFLNRAITNEIILPDQSRAGTIHFEGDRQAIFTGVSGSPPRPIKSDREGEADALTINGFVLELMERGDTFALRIRDTRVLPRPYDGIDLYPIDPSWRVHARFEKHAGGPTNVDIDFEGVSLTGVADTFISPGVVVFEPPSSPGTPGTSGTEHRLQAVFEDNTQRRLFLLFRDQTSGTETYGSGRFVYADLPDANNNLFIDFNLTMIPGCAFTVFATCPIPPKDNRLSFPIRAGEKLYLGKAIGS